MKIGDQKLLLSGEKKVLLWNSLVMNLTFSRLPKNYEEECENLLKQ